MPRLVAVGLLALIHCADVPTMPAAQRPALCLTLPDDTTAPRGPACPPSVEAVTITGRVGKAPQLPLTTDEKRFKAVGDEGRAWLDYRRCDIAFSNCMAKYPGLMSLARRIFG